ncbi:MAG TPA: class II aldolase/adducin family protein [Acidobacteriaceae bacterium]|jgi:L-fuculose-phosphate aldolase|nr:class II aldolase/adducin family protein [Acidobacteriaceae bacterium]
MDRIWEHEVTLRRDLARFGKRLYKFGFMPGTSGNLSVRLDSRFILATPTGVSKSFLAKEDMVIVDLDGKQYSGSRKVTSEIGMHLAVYNSRHDINAVAHSHPPIATAFACAGRGLTEPLCSEAIMTLGPVPLARYATTGTDEVADSLAEFIPDHEAILMANHGVVTYGKTLMDAFMKMETVEHFAQITLIVDQLGSRSPIQKDKLAALLDARTRYVLNAA